VVCEIRMVLPNEDSDIARGSMSASNRQEREEKSNQIGVDTTREEEREGTPVVDGGLPKSPAKSLNLCRKCALNLLLLTRRLPNSPKRKCEFSLSFSLSPSLSLSLSLPHTERSISEDHLHSIVRHTLIDSCSHPVHQEETELDMAKYGIFWTFQKMVIDS
jgi:hypothetical protein